MQTAIFNCSIISNGQFIPNKAIIVEKARIKNIIGEKEIPNHIEKIALHGAFLAPGFIDLQVMGAGGALFGNQPSEVGLEVMEKELLLQGTTGFLPTVSTNSTEVIEKALKSAVQYRAKSIGNFLGLHLEGPYINPYNRGAHPQEFINKATLGEITQLLDIASGEIKMMTIAPELQDKAVIKYLLDHDIILSMGHSGANYEEALSFLSGSRKAVTHLFNGMSSIHHRLPGSIPAIFLEKPYTSIVVDGIHVAYPVVKMAKNILGEFLYLISDAATSSTEGVYQHTLKVDRYVTTHGESDQETLSGCNLTMLKAIRNCVEYVGISLPEAVNMATLYPARLLGLESEKGLIQVGYEANMVAFDYHYNITEVIYNGKSKFLK